MNDAYSLKMLTKAAQCYEKAGLTQDALRVWLELENYSKAAEIYEQLEDWEAAIDCYLKAESKLKAAWTAADKLKRIYHPLEILSKIEPNSEVEAIEKEIIIARIEVNQRQKRQAGDRIRRQIKKLLRNRHQHLYDRGLKTASALERKDLSALLYATAYRARMPNAIEEWAKWAKAELGETIGIPLEPKEETFEFEVITVNRGGEIINRETREALYYSEKINSETNIEMVYIPAGVYTMGSPEGEKDSESEERPQHSVTVNPFFMSKYTITQAQWKAVANLPKVKIDLNPDPSYFKGENRPVEQVSWYDAEEFCARLSEHTGIEYRLPSEAQWEYACRAGTTTPFHFGETLTTDLANYNGDTYREEPRGENRRETTPVGSFPPNGFGLYDMHGNVLEWCADPWHENYENAPENGEIWEENGNNQRSPLRGGSWFYYASCCRSAYRDDYFRRGSFNNDVGFRVVCGVGRTL